MYLTERIAAKIGENARTVLKVDEKKEKIIVYGAIGLLQILWSILWTILIGIIFGVVYEALLFSIIVGMLKRYSGGAHASSPGRCIVIGVTAATVSGLLIHLLTSKQAVDFIIILGVLCFSTSFFIIAKKAPVDSSSKPIRSAKMRQRLNYTSKVILICYIIIMLSLLVFYKVSSNEWYLSIYMCVGLGTLWQAITLTKCGIKILNKVDFILNFKNIKGR